MCLALRQKLTLLRLYSMAHSSYRKIFMSIVHDLCEHDGILGQADDSKSHVSAGTKVAYVKSAAFSHDNNISSRPSRLRASFKQINTSTVSPKRETEKGTVSRASIARVGNIDSRQTLSRSSFIQKRSGHSRIPEALGSNHRSGFDAPGSNHRPSLLQTKGFKDADDIPRDSNREKIEGVTKSLRLTSSDFRSSVKQKSFAGTQRTGGDSGLSGLKISRGALSRSLHNNTTVGEDRTSLGASLHRASNATSLSATPKPITKEPLGKSLGRLKQRSLSVKLTRSPTSRNSKVLRRSKVLSTLRDDMSVVSLDVSTSTGVKQGSPLPYFEKLCSVCEKLDYPYEYADIVGSQFLGLDGASPVTHVDGHVPTMDELVEFLALAFISLADFADLTMVLLDDFQWVDSFSWKIFRVLCKRGQKMLVMCATRSHDKQALRRLSVAASGQTQLQSQMIEISLGPLDFNEIRELIAKVLGQEEWAVSDPLCSDIFQRTGGLPVYVAQMLENIKRKQTLQLDDNGLLQWTEEGLQEKRAASSNKTGVMMEETFLSRFDTLDVRVRKVLQTCAVLGLSFSLSDVIQVHPELEELDIENAMDASIDEMILVEHVEDEDDDDNMTMESGEGGESENASFALESKSRDSTTFGKALKDRFFQFSHAMWRQNVLATMLKERKIELHRRIAEAMEKDQVLILEQSDISRLLTLFDHWKSCGDFCKTAPLALAVGSRLEEWELSAQSLELYEDALEMSFDSVQEVDESESEERKVGSNEWVSVAAKPAVLDYILRLHIRIGLCHQSLGDEYESIAMFEDAYNIIKTASKIPGMSAELMMPIISSLCVLKLDQIASDTQSKLQQEKLIEKFVKEAFANGNPVHIGRALSMEATHYAKLGNFDKSFQSLSQLSQHYSVEVYSFDILAEYGRDFAMECYSESVQWLYLQEQHTEAERQADMVMEKYLPLLEDVESDIAMYAILPLVQVLKLIGRADDAYSLLKEYVINPYRESGSVSDFWAPLFNPLAYLLELIIMEEEEEEEDRQVLNEMEEWIMDEANDDFETELEYKAHTTMGEICWRLIGFKEPDDPTCEVLKEMSLEWLTPVARYPHSETFLKHTAQALLDALNEEE
jgi:hypothetical protein